MSEILRFVMDNAEEILQSLESFSKLKPKEIPKELDDYLGYVAKTGDPVYQWQYVRCLFHEKLAKVITEFYETSPTVDLPPCPNVDPFNYERMKTSLLERLDNFHNAPFTVQRICELLTSPRKQYNRVDKFMRAIEKNILVVSTREPGFAKRSEADDSVLTVNGVPENKDNDAEVDRVNLPLDGLTPNNASCSPSVTVENAVNSCVIQEEIEINSASSTTAAEDKGWLETNEGKMSIDPATQTTEIDKSEVSTSNNISKTDVVSTSSDLDRASSSMFLESSEKLHSEESSTADQSKLINVATAADSPESPEPRPDEVLCDASSDEDSCSPQKNYSEGFQPREDDSQSSEVEVTEKTDEPTEELEQLDSAPDSEAVSVVIKSCESLQQIDSTEQQLSPLSMAPDSSNECFTNDESGNANDEGITVSQQEEDSQPDTISTITSSQVHNQDEAFESVAVVSEDSSDTQKPEEHVQVEIPESEEVTEGISNVTSENECSVSIEEVTDTKETEEEEVDNKESDVVVEAPIEREVIVEEGEDEEDVEKKVVTEFQESTEVVEVSASSTFEVTDETAEAEEEEAEEEEEPRESGSVIHTTQSVCPAEQELEVEAESSQQEVAEDKIAVEENQVEAICIDQSSCEATSEAEAMDVDDNTSNQMAMTIGEVEMNEGEPMDQSDQAQA